MEIKTIQLKAKIQHPVRIAHITDLHLTLSGSEETPEHRGHAQQRTTCYAVDGDNPAAQNLKDILKAIGNFDLLLLTGDIIDFPSRANLEALGDLLSGTNYIYCHGNHDWNYPDDYPFGTANWDYTKSDLYDHALSLTAESFRDYQTGFDVKTVGGVKVIGINNSNYRFSPEQYCRLHNELQDGMPAIAAFHIPLFAPSLMPDTVAYWGLPIVCAGDADVHEKWAYRPDEATLKTATLLGQNKNMLAVISGHLHFFHTDILPGGNTQYVTALAQRGNASIFEILPL